jgi:phenylacetate-CoA ligase
MSTRTLRRSLLAVHDALKGKPTLAWLRRLDGSQWLAPETVADMQLQGLQRLLRHAFETVPYHRRALDAVGLAPDDVRSVGDLGRLPYLTRDDLRLHAVELTSVRAPRRVQRISTGGSTGAPVTVLVTMEAHGFAEGARLRAQGWFGLQVGDREAVLWGSSIELERQSRWREIRDRLLGTRLLSAFDLGETALARYSDCLQHLRPAKIYGYGSALALLAGYLARTRRRPGPGWPRAIFATAEPLYDFQRDLIRRVFGCPVAVEYGARDAGLIAHECSEGRLHINAEGMIVEVDAGAESEPGTGEIVVTNLLSDAMPLIRYRTGDVARSGSPRCACGRTLPTLGAVEGRQTDFLVTADGRIMHALAAIYVLREAPGVREFQVVQEDVDRIVVTVVPAEGFQEQTREHITTRLAALFGPGATVEVVTTPQIPRPPSGKHRYVISKVARERTQALLQS